MEGVSFARDLTSEPANVLGTVEFASRLLALKGMSAAEEIAEHGDAVARLGGGPAVIHQCGVGLIDTAAYSLFGIFVFSITFLVIEAAAVWLRRQIDTAAPGDADLALGEG